LQKHGCFRRGRHVGRLLDNRRNKTPLAVAVVSAVFVAVP
jgi:hypothetical protein